MLTLSAVLIVLGISLAAHVTPNIGMKMVKSTGFGHRLLSGLFSAGVKLGCQGKVLRKGFESFIKYAIGPEALVEYEMGLRIGSELRPLGPKAQQEYLDIIKEMTLSEFEAYSDEVKEEILNTPFTSTMIAYSRGEVNTTLERIIVKFSHEEEKKGRMGYVINLALLAIACYIQPHVIVQPIICFIRDKTGRSKFGQEFMKKRFIKGLEGEHVSKPERLFWDYLVSPSALDTQRFGNTVRKIVE